MSTFESLAKKLNNIKQQNGALPPFPPLFQVANMLYVDQPVGTGYSYINNNEYCDDDNCINTHFYIFLQKFFKLHDNFLVAGGGKTRPLFFSGESHAGHYIPNMIAHIVRMNEGGKKSSDVLIDVQGGAIGNGWIDPVNQVRPNVFNKFRLEVLQSKTDEVYDGAICSFFLVL